MANGITQIESMPSLQQLQAGRLVGGFNVNPIIDAVNGLGRAPQTGQVSVPQHPSLPLRLKITKLKALGIYGVKIIEDSLDPTQTGDLTNDNLGNVPDDENAELWDIVSIRTGINTLAVDDVVEGRYAQTRTTGDDKGTNIFIREAGVALVPVRITGSTQDGGNYRWEYDIALLNKSGVKWDGWTTGSVTAKGYAPCEAPNGSSTDAGNVLSGYTMDPPMQGINGIMALPTDFAPIWAMPVTVLDEDGNTVTEYWFVGVRNDPIINCSPASSDDT